MEFLHPAHSSDTVFLSGATRMKSLAVRWAPVTAEASLLAQLSGIWTLSGSGVHT